MGKFNLSTREEFFLGKVAGRDVDIKTLTPPVETSAFEELMSEIAERIGDTEKATANATTTAAGVVKQSANVPTAAGDNPTAEEFNALINALISAGIMASSTPQS